MRWSSHRQRDDYPWVSLTFPRGDHTSAAPPPSPGGNPVPPPASFPTGAYTATITAQQAPSDLVGTWILTFRANGKWSLVNQEARIISVTGTYTVLGHELSILERTNTFVGDVCTEVGTYTWTHAPPLLTLSGVYDNCGLGGRRIHFTVNPWRRSP